METLLDLSEIRRMLAAERGPRYWQCLEELAAKPEFEEMLHREFPREASVWENDEPGRRNFLKLMGASLALAGLTACSKQPDEKIVPYVRQPEEIVPGKPLYFATAFTVDGAATGVLVESHMGRPTKIEGNPEHPASLGAADVLAQASVLGLYDPDRSQTVTRFGEISSWDKFTHALREALADQKPKQGAGIRILTEMVTSPTLAWQINAFLAAYPKAKWHQYQPAFASLDKHYKIENADVILALDSDFLTSGPGHLRYAREFAAKRRVEGEHAAMNRLYVVEPAPTATGSKADHRWAVRASDIHGIAEAIAQELGAGTASAQAPAWVKAVAADLAKNRGASLVIAGPEQTPLVHSLVDGMNRVLGNVGKTVIETEPVEARPEDPMASLKSLVAEIETGAVEMLVILGGNPVYNAPADVPLLPNLNKAPLRIRLGLYDDETSAICQWHIPEAHYLEAWSDTRAYDGTVTIQQPLIAPLYRGKSVHEFLTAMMEQPERAGYDIVRDYWRGRQKPPNFESWWRKAVHDGVVPGTEAGPRNMVALHVSLMKAPAAGIEINFRLDPAVHDGRFANNGWLQELPKPLTKLTWDNAALVSISTAEKLGLQTGDEVELRYQGRSVRAAALLTPGHANDSVTVHLGYGRTRAGRVANGAGFNAYTLRPSGAWFGAGLEIRKTGGNLKLAVTHGHWQMEGRALVRSGTLDEYKKEPAFAKHMEHMPPKELTLYPEFKYEGYAWGMAIDLNSCTGCNACVVACQAENNIPVVGKDQVLNGREMHWIRLDRYFEGSLDAPAIHHQPVLCQHCENAPCEVVCPVAATVHSDEGLNDMVYNRCVGTRYCSHNCPYKVRRFNFLLYSDFVNETVGMQKNPDVTVRSRGVMEKCSYCVQRINKARIEAAKDDRQVRDGEIQTACQQTCPSQAISFGNINDKSSRVAKLKAEEREYSLLGELNTRPRTTYLAPLRNPNPEIHS